MAKAKSKTTNPHFSAPYCSVRVKEVSVNDTVITVKFNARKQTGGSKTSLETPLDKKVATFDCGTEEHARAVASHIKKLHARRHRNDLIYSIRKLAEGKKVGGEVVRSGPDVLKEAKRKATYNKKVRDDIKEEKAKQRRMEEERRQKAEKAAAA